MATEQIMSEVITKAVAEATRVAIQAMAEVQAEQMHDTGRTQDRWFHAMEQPTFDWDAEDKYTDIKDTQARGK